MVYIEVRIQQNIENRIYTDWRKLKKYIKELFENDIANVRVVLI